MIRCPSCGTFNHDSQRACRSCGSALPQTRRRCPACGALNPVGNLFCDRCNARLVETEEIVPTPAPLSPQDSHAVKGISLPTRAQGTHEDTGQRTELPDWLAGLVDEDTEFGLTEPAKNGMEVSSLEPDLSKDALPEWLGGVEAAAPASLSEATEAPSLPEWLSGGVGHVAGATADVAGEDEALPDWLNDVFGSDAVAADEGPAVQETSVPLREDGEPAHLTEARGAAIFSESELPDWLAQVQALPIAETGSAKDATDEVSGEPMSEPLDAASAADQKSGELHIPAEDEDLVLPDWLQEIAAEDSGLEQLPTWLTTLSREQASATAEVAGEASMVAKEESVPAQPLAPAASSIFVEESSLPDAAETNVAELPGWLNDLAPAEPSSSPRPGAQVFVDQNRAEGSEIGLPSPVTEGPDQMPGWLEDLDLKASKATPTAGSAPELVDLARAEVPSWLQELAPPGALGASIEEPAVAADRIAPAVIPEWVEALRPEAREEGAPPPARAIPPTPAEPEGPLEGLAGVLSSTNAVDFPEDASLAAIERVPEAIITQAQLWQRLLEQPRSAERSVWHGRPRNPKRSGLFRWAVSALLIVGLSAAFWLIPEGLRLAQVSPTQIAPGVPALVDSVDRLQAGDTVIVAIEYSPAYADEMSQIATPILAHLSSRQVETLIVSSLPEGVGLGNALSSVPNKVAVTGSGYLAGNASGIAAFLAQPEAATADHLVVLGSEPQRLIWWLEQNALLGADALPISVGTSASAGPLVAPYFKSAEVEGWVTGLPQALAYWETRGDGPGEDYSRILDLLMIAHWAVAGLLLVAFFYTLFIRKGAS